MTPQLTKTAPAAESSSPPSSLSLPLDPVGLGLAVPEGEPEVVGDVSLVACSKRSTTKSTVSFK